LGVHPALLLIFGVPLTWIAPQLVSSGHGEITGIIDDEYGRPPGRWRRPRAAKPVGNSEYRRGQQQPTGRTIPPADTEARTS
jgi:hypothetical protein